MSDIPLCASFSTSLPFISWWFDSNRNTNMNVAFGMEWTFFWRTLMIHPFCGANDTLFGFLVISWPNFKAWVDPFSCVFHHWIPRVTSEYNTCRPLGGQKGRWGPYPHTFSSFVRRHYTGGMESLFKHWIDCFPRQFVRPSAKHVCKINRSKYTQINTS